MMICKVCNQYGDGYCAKHSTSGTSVDDLSIYPNKLKNPMIQPKCICKSMSKETIAEIGHFLDCPMAEKPKIEKWEKEFDRIYYYQRVEKPDGRYILVCQNSYLIEKISKLLQAQRLEIIDDHKKGLRCLNCGSKKKGELTDYCDKCLESC